jgi:hypothetical protein
MAEAEFAPKTAVSKLAPSATLLFASVFFQLYHHWALFIYMYRHRHKCIHIHMHMYMIYTNTKV